MIRFKSPDLLDLDRSSRLTEETTIRRIIYAADALFELRTFTAETHTLSVTEAVGIIVTVKITHKNLLINCLFSNFQ